jgi:hypothetical protein
LICSIEPNAQLDPTTPDEENAESTDRARWIRELELKTRQIRDLMDGTLPTAVDPASLFDVDLHDAVAVTIEAARLQSLLNSAYTGSDSPKQGGTAHGVAGGFPYRRRFRPLGTSTGTRSCTPRGVSAAARGAHRAAASSSTPIYG